MIFTPRRSLSEVSLHQPDAVAVCLDASELGCDAAVLDGLARLALDLRRAGYRLVLRNAPHELIDLIELSGLAQALPASPPQASLD
jgi:hypothetical protein